MTKYFAITGLFIASLFHMSDVVKSHNFTDRYLAHLAIQYDDCLIRAEKVPFFKSKCDPILADIERIKKEGFR